MSNKQPEALRLADLPMSKAAIELRRLHEVNQELVEAAERIEKICAKSLYPCPDKPDSDWGALVQLRDAIAKARGEG